MPETLPESVWMRCHVGRNLRAIIASNVSISVVLGHITAKGAVTITVGYLSFVVVSRESNLKVLTTLSGVAMNGKSSDIGTNRGSRPK